MRYDCFERLDSFPKPDSTLLELTQYYNSIGDSAKLCRAYYFNARQLHSDYFYIRAMVNYRKAERLAANVDSTLLFQIKMHLVPIYHFNQQATTEMETLNEAISLAIQLNDSLLLSKAYKTEAMLHREHKRYEEALVSFNKACSYTPFDNRKWKAEMLMEKARTQLSLDKLEQALTTLDKAIATDSTDVPQAYRAKVCIKYFMSPDPDSHGKFLNIVQQMPLMEKMNAYRNAAHWLQLHGMSEEALACMKKYTDLRDSLDMNRKDIFLERARMLQDFKRQQERVAEAENERTSDWMLFYRLLALFALSLLLLFAFYHNMRRKKVKTGNRYPTGEKRKLPPDAQAAADGNAVPARKGSKGKDGNRPIEPKGGIFQAPECHNGADSDEYPQPDRGAASDRRGLGNGCQQH